MEDPVEPLPRAPVEPERIVGDIEPSFDIAPLLAALTESLSALSEKCGDALLAVCRGAPDPLKLFDQLAVETQMRILTAAGDDESLYTSSASRERHLAAVRKIMSNIRAKLLDNEKR